MESKRHKNAVFDGVIFLLADVVPSLNKGIPYWDPATVFICRTSPGN